MRQDNTFTPSDAAIGVSTGQMAAIVESLTAAYRMNLNSLGLTSDDVDLKGFIGSLGEAVSESFYEYNQRAERRFEAEAAEAADDRVRG